MPKWLLILVFSATTFAQPEAVDKPMQPIEQAASATFHVDGYPDFLEFAYGALWISNEGVNAVQRMDPKTGRMLAQVPVNMPCGAMGAGYGALWVASCKDGELLRIDARSNQVTARLPLKVADPETSIAAGAGGVWILTDDKGILTRADPKTNSVVAQISVAPHSYAAMAGYGAVWVTNTGAQGAPEFGSVQRINPKTNAVAATIEVRGQPRFLAVGEGAVWVLNQTDGTVSRINPRTNKVVATIEVGVPGPGGDIAAGGGGVWVRATKTLLAVIDPKTNRVVMRYGPPQGSGAVRVGDDSVWVSAHDVNKIWRLRSLQ